jgi:hypothetical protein
MDFLNLSKEVSDQYLERGHAVSFPVFSKLSQSSSQFIQLIQSLQLIVITWYNIGQTTVSTLL